MKGVFTMDALQAIFTRRSTRLMKPEIPEKELIEKVIEAGCDSMTHISIKVRTQFGKMLS